MFDKRLSIIEELVHLINVDSSDQVNDKGYDMFEYVFTADDYHLEKTTSDFLDYKPRHTFQIPQTKCHFIYSPGFLSNTPDPDFGLIKISISLITSAGSILKVHLIITKTNRSYLVNQRL